MKGCKFCEKMATKVREFEDWDREHKAHGNYTREPFNHPSGKWFWICCPCGAKYLTIEQLKAAEAAGWKGDG